MGMLEARLQVLEDMKYLDEDGKLTDKGKLCALVNGFEIPITEMYYQGVFERLNEEKLILVFVGIVYEPRGRDDGEEVRPKAKYQRAAQAAVTAFQRAERNLGIEDTVRGVNFEMSGAALHWARGAAFEDLARQTDANDGDLVRTFRLSIQLMRQLRKAIPDDRDLGERLTGAIRLLNRDVVDAERQLNLGAVPTEVEKSSEEGADETTDGEQGTGQNEAGEREDVPLQ